MSALTTTFDAGAGIAEELLLERRRQLVEKDYVPGHDDKYIDGQIASAAGAYAAAAAHLQWAKVVRAEAAVRLWPWPRQCKVGSVRRMLVKAGALIIAEIERLDRKAAAEGGGQ